MWGPVVPVPGGGGSGALGQTQGQGEAGVRVKAASALCLEIPELSDPRCWSHGTPWGWGWD